MKLEEHVLKAIDAFDRGEKDHALLHATFAIEATTRNLYPNKKIGKKDYKICIRQYCWIVERFIGEGLNLEETKFTNLRLDDGNGKLVENPDLADIVYHIFRCYHAHAREIPIKYEILPSKNGHYIWKIDRINNAIQIPETIIWALLAISIFSKANAIIKTKGEYFLTWGNETIGLTRFVIRDHWGKENELKSFFSTQPQNRVILNNL